MFFRRQEPQGTASTGHATGVASTHAGSWSHGLGLPLLVAVVGAALLAYGAVLYGLLALGAALSIGVTQRARKRGRRGGRSYDSGHSYAYAHDTSTSSDAYDHRDASDSCDASDNSGWSDSSDSSDCGSSSD